MKTKDKNITKELPLKVYDVNNFKRCSKCKQSFPATKKFFYKNSTLKIGLDSWCKDCKRKYDKLRHKKIRYGMTLNKLNRMIESQNNRCAICGRNFRGVFKSRTVLTPRVDHDHKTAKIRGLLCDRCNLLLGKANEIFSF